MSTTSEQVGPPQAPPRPVGMGPAGWLRWAWRQLTSMRTALILLFLLALGTVPGSLLPQRGLAPEKVTEYFNQHKTLAPILDKLSLFDVFVAPWFAAIYLLLFISLAGCVIPRSYHHLRAINAAPPAAPRNLSRLPQSATFESGPDVMDQAADLLRDRRFRVRTGQDAQGAWVAAEKGYLSEAGNLVFHLALLVLLVAVGAGAALGYRGNVLVVEGDGFANTLTAYDAFKSGREFTPSDLAPFSVRLDDFRAGYLTGGPNRGQPTSFVAKVRYKERPSSPERPYDLRVNHPLAVGGAKVYLLGHGYAPTFTVRDGDGQVAFDGAVPFLPREEATFTSEGVIKVPDARPEQLGFLGLFWPTALQVGDQTVSVFPAPNNPAVSLFAFKGDLGLDSGAPQSVYQLDGRRLQRIKMDPKPLRINEPMPLGGKASITFTGYKEWISLQVNHDPGRVPALVAGIIAIIGIVTSFLVRRRRVWVRADDQPGARTVVEVGGLALGGAHAEFDEIVSRLKAASEVSPETPTDKE